MLGAGKAYKRAIRQWFADCQAFFSDTAKTRSERNWEILHPMLILYLAYPCIYLFAVCPVLDIPLQTSVVQAFTIVHAVFTLLVFLYGKKAPAVWVVDLAISLFAAQILGLSGFLGIVVFPNEASFLFPLCLVLMTQIYTRHPVYSMLEVLLPSAAYLICCWLTKDPHFFLLDVISISIAIGISGTALFSITNYKLRAYHAQVALQKMCMLDPMTSVNNKPTFEFLVENFLRSCPKSGYALALCDLDDFKIINDSHGHRVGDKVLQAFSVQLHRLVDNDPDLIAGRFGGDEFVLFVKQYASRQDVLKKLGSLASVSGFDFPVTCSIGIAFSQSGNAGFTRLFDVADQSLYQVKNGKSDKICAADAE